MHGHQHGTWTRRIRGLICTKCGGIIGIQCDGNC